MLHCFSSARNKNIEPPPKTVTIETSIPFRSEAPMTKTNEEILITIPGATLHLVEGGETTELDKGELAIIRLTQENVVLATLIKIGSDHQWPLTKDEPVIKLDQLHYLFSLPSGDGSFLNYGVTFSKPNSRLAVLDSFFMENSCFSSPSTTTAAAAKSSYPPGLYWKDFAPRVDDYNGVLAKAIAGGTGEIIKGIFKCSNAYAQQVQKGGEMVRACNEENTNTLSAEGSKRNTSVAGKSEIQKSLKRVRKLSKMTEKMSKSLLDGVLFATGSVTEPLIRSQAGKAFLNTALGEVLLASLDGLNKVFVAAEVAEKQAFSATTGAVKGAVSRRFGESAGEVTEDVLATAGHAVGTAWNIFKIRKAINPKWCLPSAAVKIAVKKKPDVYFCRNLESHR
ncbi:senescence/dehydration-associated protein, chloroplastic [Cinnamomum micranthum f. kanehirae]|uniref:Senescence/dehydration-associated protein, chloroplastic n=1 Tax=Cinnamomum micranthum f. kanehirae TaxID=337451 RepID=A0A3S3M713_9MAGN|nr:senescence/dehydration-associated protein, chloroplastic [Cinnamomum micranthum f. kanehirae]